MENHRIKSLSLDPRSRNRFRFATQKQREQRATADVYRGYKRRIGVASSANREEAVHHTKEPPAKKSRTEEDASPSVVAIEDLQSASLAEELDLAFDRNPSEVFSKFYRQIWYHVRSLPEILHHREKIVKLMLDYLLTAEEETSDEEGVVRYQPNQATTDILHLLAVLARDLRHEIHPFLHTQILPRLVNDLLNPPMAKKQHVPLDVSIIEACIRTMSYCFRYDSETLVSETLKEGDQPCLEPMRQYYGKTLAHRREVVRRLSAQAFAPLIRRLPNEGARKRHLKRIFRAMSSVASDSTAIQRAQENAADGIALLCLELVQGVSGQLHSKAHSLIKTILECSCVNHEKEAANKVLLIIGKQFVEGLCTNLKTAVACTVYEHLMKLLAKYIQEKKDSISILTLLELSKQIVVFEDGALVRTSDSINDIIATLTAFFEPAFLMDLSPDVRAASFGLLCLIWRAYPEDKKVAESVACIIEAAIPVLFQDENGHNFLLGLLTKKILPVLPLNLSMRTLGSILLRSAAQQKNRDFTVSLVLALSSVQEVDEESYVETDTVMFLENAMQCDVSPETCESLLKQCIVDLDDPRIDGNIELVSSAIQGAVFVGMLCCRKMASKKWMMNVFKQVTSWIHLFIEKITLTGGYKSKGTIGLPFAVCVSLAVDGLSRYAAATGKFVGEANMAIKESLLRAKDSIASHLENYPSSLWTAKSCAAFARLLQDTTGKLLIDDSNKAFDLLVPNLSRSSHFFRLHCLEILSTYPDKPFISDHADLDLADDLDEEPSKAPQTQEAKKSGFSGVCQILHTLISIEKTTADLRNERKLTSSLATIEVQGRSGKLPVPYVEAAVSHMIGLLHVRFSPLWPSVQSAIVSLIQGCDQYAWSYLQKKIVDLMFCPPFPSQSPSENFDFHDGTNLLRAYIQWDQTGGLEVSMFRTSISVSEDNGRVSRHLVRSVDDVVLSLWGTLEKKAQLIVQHSRDIVGVILRFLVVHFYREDDPDVIELKLKSHVQWNEISEHGDGQSPGRKAVENRLLAILKVFAKVNGPQQMHKHTVLFPVFVSLLGYADSLAQAALSSMLKFKPGYLLPYSDVLKKLFAKGGMREALLELKELKKDGTIPRDHRQKLVPFITRILLGRVSSKNTSRSAKDSPAARRTAIFSFLSGFCESQEELYPAVYLAIRQFLPLDTLKEIELQTLEDRQLLLVRMREIGKQECSRLPTPVHEGFLNVLEAMISQLGLHAVQFVPAFLSIVLGLLEIYSIGASKQQEAISEDDCDDPQNSRSSRIRALCFRRLSELFDRFASMYDFTDSIERMWECIGPSLEGLPESAASSDKSPALMILLRTLSSHANLVPVLQLKQQATRAMVESLGKASSVSAVDTILSFVENLLGLDETETEVNHVGPEIVHNHLASLLDSFKCRMSRSGNSMTLKREIRVLCGVSDLIAKNDGITKCGTATVDALAELLLPYLGRESRVSEQYKSHIVSVLQTLIPSLSNDVAKGFYLSLSQTLGPTKNGGVSLATRHAIAQTLYRVAANHFDQAKPAADVLLGLCALNSKRVGELDYDSSITMLQRLSKEQDELSWSRLSAETTEWLAPLIHTCFQFLHDDDGVLTRTSLKALRVLVSFASSRCVSEKDACAVKNFWTRLLEGQILPMTRSGLQMKGDSIRRMYIQLLSTIVSECKDLDSLHLHGDLAVLKRDENIDLDFFQGICHVQIHRRAKALTRLRRELDEEDKQTCRFSLQSLSNILLPLVMHPIYETKSKDEDSFALEAVSTIGSIARLLSWSKYNNLIGTLLNQFQRHPDQEKYIVGTICSVLDNMDFDLVSGDADSESAAMRTLERRIIPKTETLLTKEVKKSGKKEKSIRPSIVLALLKLAQRLPRDFFHLKLHRLLAVICDALKNRDSSIREIARTTLGKMAVSIDIVFLPDIVRELAISLKEGYQLHVRSASVHTILLELVDQFKNGLELRDGYSGRAAFDSSVPALLDLIQDDMFGAAQERKDAEGDSQIRFVKEASGSKSMHSLELIALMISFDPASNTKWKRSTIDILVAPFLERLKSPGQNSKGIRRVKECLDRIVQGLAKNAALTAEKAFGFSYATINHYIQQDSKGESLDEDDEDGLEENVVESLKVSSSSQQTSQLNRGGKDKAKGSLSEWRPSVQHMPKSDREAAEARRIESRNLRKVQDGSSAPILTGSGRRAVASGKDNVWNDPASSSAVTFGLQTLQIALKKDVRHAELLDPFVPLLSDCICMSGDTEILRLSMKALGGMLNSELPSIKNCSARLSKKTVDLLATSRGNEELQHSCFKLLMYLLKAGSSGSSSDSIELPLLNDQSRMDVLLSFIKQSILESEQHSQATSLLKVIVSFQYSSPDLYDLMECLLEQSVRSPKESLRLQCSAVYLSFLLNYPMTEDRLEQELKQVILNVGYEYSDGRLSAVNLVNLIVSRLPVGLVEKKSQLFFLPLTMQLANDTSDECRQAVAVCIKSLLGRISFEICLSLFEYTSRWIESFERLLRRTALQLYGLFLEASPSFCRRQEVADRLLSNVEKVLDQLDDNDWESIYFALSSLEKLSTEYRVDPLDGTHGVFSTAVLDGVVHEHAWVQLVSNRLVWKHLKTLDPTSFYDMDKTATFLSESGVLFKLGRNFCSALSRLREESNSSSNESEMTTTVIKSLTWTLRAMHKYPLLCFSDGMTQEDKSPTRWILKRLSGIAKPKVRNRRQAVFKCFASFVSSSPQEVIKDNLDCILEPLHRVELESSNDTFSSQWQRDREPATLSAEAELAQEVLRILESTYEDAFLETYGAVRKKAKTNKDERKRQEKSEAARDPKLAAEQKIQKQTREKKRRKRRVDERRKDRGVGSAKRRHVNHDD